MFFSHQLVCLGQETQCIVSAQIPVPAPALRASLTTAELSCCKQVFGQTYIHPHQVMLLKNIELNYFIQFMHFFFKQLQFHPVWLQYLMLSIQQSTPRGKNMLMSIQRVNQLSVFLKHSQLTTSGLSTLAWSWFPKLPGTVEKHTVNPARAL